MSDGWLALVLTTGVDVSLSVDRVVVRDLGCSVRIHVTFTSNGAKTKYKC